MVAIDAGFLGLMLHPTAKPPNDPATQRPTEKVKERIEKLLEELDSANERLIIPAPALSEFLVLAGKDGPQYLSYLSLQSSFSVRPFDQMAAIELAGMELLARAKGSKRHPVATDAPWQKVKFDRQIVAVSKLHGAHTIFSDDADIKNIAEEVGIKVVACWALDIPKSKTPLLETGAAPIILS
jgi:predicted nucleic acid-binding protein